MVPMLTRPTVVIICNIYKYRIIVHLKLMLRQLHLNLKKWFIIHSSSRQSNILHLFTKSQFRRAT